MKQQLNIHLKQFFFVLIFIVVSNISIAQQIQAGNYDAGLQIAYDSQTKYLTGYFEDYSGWDGDMKIHRFSCVFYLKGTLTDSIFDIETYYPGDRAEDLIKGSIQVLENNRFNMKLLDEHGGCWNVQHFADEPFLFELTTPQPWIQIRYVTSVKAYFHSQKSANKKLKSYVIKNNFVCIEKIEGAWAYVNFYGDKKTTKGWMMLSDLNPL